MNPFTTVFDFLDSCPWCQHPIDAVTHMEQPDVCPQVGDVAVCLECGKPAVYTITMRLRRPLPGELEECPDSFARMLKYQAAVRQLRDTAAARAGAPRVRFQPRKHVRRRR